MKMESAREESRAVGPPVGRGCSRTLSRAGRENFVNLANSEESLMKTKSAFSPD